MQEQRSGGPGGPAGTLLAIALVVPLQKPVFTEHSVCYQSKSETTAGAQGHGGATFRQGFSLESPKSWLTGGTKGGSLLWHASNDLSDTRHVPVGVWPQGSPHSPQASVSQQPWPPSTAGKVGDFPLGQRPPNSQAFGEETGRLWGFQHLPGKSPPPLRGHCPAEWSRAQLSPGRLAQLRWECQGGKCLAMQESPPKVTVLPQAPPRSQHLLPPPSPTPCLG